MSREQRGQDSYSVFVNEVNSALSNYNPDLRFSGSSEKVDKIRYYYLNPQVYAAADYILSEAGIERYNASEEAINNIERDTRIIREAISYDDYNAYRRAIDNLKNPNCNEEELRSDIIRYMRMLLYSK